MTGRAIRACVIVVIVCTWAGCSRTEQSRTTETVRPQGAIPQPQAASIPAQEQDIQVAQQIPKAPPPGAHYRVAKTDTAKSIAVRFYGDERYAEDILELNKEALRKARGLKAGMVIVLPATRQRDTTARP